MFMIGHVMVFRSEVFIDISAKLMVDVEQGSDIIWKRQNRSNFPLMMDWDNPGDVDLDTVEERETLLRLVYKVHQFNCATKARKIF